VTLFPLSFLSAIVYGGIAVVALGTVSLLALFLRDARRGRLW
jgi:hypothetical protein